MNNLNKNKPKKHRNLEFRPGNGAEKYIDPKSSNGNNKKDDKKSKSGKFTKNKIFSNKKNDGKFRNSKPPSTHENEIQKVTKTENTKSENLESKSSFTDFGLDPTLMKAINEVGYKTPTLIQDQTIKPIMEQKDVLGIAKTGSGKTAAFALPILHNLLQQKHSRKKQPKVLVLSPTRELAIQITESFAKYGKQTDIKQITIYGGVSQRPQVQDVRRGAEIMVATPGRLLDLINQKIIQLEYIQTLIIDEADRMFDMGFIPDIKKIVSKIPSRDQTLLFSATMPLQILDLAKKFLKSDFVHVTGDLQTIPVNQIEQEIFFVEKQNKMDLLEGLLKSSNVNKALIFSKTKHGADKLVRKLKYSSFRTEAMHGNKSQQNRQKVLQNFKNNRTQIVVATDLAARGLDVDDITHVINFDLPPEPETYMHRIGRTARAGKTGTAISFCAIDERKYIQRIEDHMGFHIPRAVNNPHQSTHKEPRMTELSSSKTSKKSPRKFSNNSRKESFQYKGKKRYSNYSQKN